MRRVIIQRDPSGDQGTPGKLTTDAGFTCATLELPARNNAPDISCVPAGTYLVVKDYSGKRSRYVYELRRVPGRREIQFHKGNWAGRKELGLRADTEGCILLGKSIGELKGQLAVLASEVTVAAFEAAMHNEPFELVILDAPAETAQVKKPKSSQKPKATSEKRAPAEKKAAKPKKTSPAATATEAPSPSPEQAPATGEAPDPVTTDPST